MQNTETSKISRRFYIDHASDDRAVVRTVTVVIDHAAQPATHQLPAIETPPSTQTAVASQRRISRLMHNAVRHTHRKRA
jgi:hypothetical protein